MDNSVTMISNESEPKHDGEAIAVARTEKHLITLGDAGRFGVCCLLFPGFVLTDAVACIEKGKTLGWIVSSKSNPSDCGNGFVAGCFLFAGGIGVAAGGVASLFLGDFLTCVAAAVIGTSWVVPNAVAGGIGILDGAPLAFRIAARKVSATASHKALRCGVRKLLDTPISGDQPRLQGPR